MKVNGKAIKPVASQSEAAPAKPEEPEDRVAALREEKEHLYEERQRLIKVQQGSHGAAQVVAEARAALEALDAEEREAWQRWAESPRASEPKPVDEDRRREANQKLALAERDARGATNASLGVSIRISEIGVRVGEIDNAIRLEALAAISNQFGECLASFDRIVAKPLKPLLTDLRAMPEAVREIGEAARRRGDMAFSEAAYRTLARMNEMKLPEPEPQYSEVVAAAATWRKAFAEMGVR